MSKKIIFFLIVASMISVISFGQESEKKEAREQVRETKKDLADADKKLDKGSNESGASYREFQKEAEKKLTEADQNIAELEVKVAKLDKNDQAKYESRVKDLKKTSKSLKNKLNGYKEEKDMGKLEEFQEEFQKDMNNLDKALDNFFEDNKK